LDVLRVVDQALARVHQLSIEQLDERVAHVAARQLEPAGDGRVAVSRHLAIPTVEELHVPRLVDLLRGEERLLLLILVGHDEPGELRRYALLADEERREPPQAFLAIGLGELRPVVRVLAQVDLLRGPLLALPELVELLRLHELDVAAELSLVGDRARVDLLRELEERGHVKPTLTVDSWPCKSSGAYCAFCRRGE